VRAFAFELAAFNALREMEGRVAEFAADGTRNLVCVVLLRHAFNERDGLTTPAPGGFGAVRNPLGHRTVESDDATEATAIVPPSGPPQAATRPSPAGAHFYRLCFEGDRTIRLSSASASRPERARVHTGGDAASDPPASLPRCCCHVVPVAARLALIGATH
jgi:hypothetical protein